MKAEKYIVYVCESDGWVRAAQSFPTATAAIKAVEECGYAPDEYYIVKEEKEIQHGKA